MTPQNVDLSLHLRSCGFVKALRALMLWCFNSAQRGLASLMLESFIMHEVFQESDILSSSETLGT